MLTDFEFLCQSIFQIWNTSLNSEYHKASKNQSRSCITSKLHSLVSLPGTSSEHHTRTLLFLPSLCSAWFEVFPKWFPAMVLPVRHLGGSFSSCSSSDWWVVNTAWCTERSYVVWTPGYNNCEIRRPYVKRCVSYEPLQTRQKCTV